MSQWVAITGLLIGALLLGGCLDNRNLPEVGKAPERHLINEIDGTYQGVGLDDTRARVIDEFGPVPRSAKPLGPGPHPKKPPPEDSDSEVENHSTGFGCQLPPAGGPNAVEPYPDVAFYTDTGIVCNWIASRDGASTNLGVAIGDPLSDADAAYPNLRCGKRTLGEDNFGYTHRFKFCAGKVRNRRYIWFGGDPIDTIQMNSKPL